MKYHEEGERRSIYLGETDDLEKVLIEERRRAVSPIVTIYEEPKPYLSDLDAAKAAISYVRWHSAGDDAEDILLWALI